MKGNAKSSRGVSTSSASNSVIDLEFRKNSPIWIPIVKEQEEPESRIGNFIWFSVYLKWAPSVTESWSVYIMELQPVNMHNKQDHWHSLLPNWVGSR